MSKTKKSVKLNRNQNSKKSKNSNNNNSQEFKIEIGSRAQVFNGTARRTSGGLKRKDLVKNAKGDIVSRNKSVSARDCNKNPLCIRGMLQKKNSGKFGPQNKDSENNISKPKSKKPKSKKGSTKKSSNNKKAKSKKGSTKKDNNKKSNGILGFLGF